MWWNLSPRQYMPIALRRSVDKMIHQKKNKGHPTSKIYTLCSIIAQGALASAKNMNKPTFRVFCALWWPFWILNTRSTSAGCGTQTGGKIRKFSEELILVNFSTCFPVFMRKTPQNAVFWGLYPGQFAYRLQDELYSMLVSRTIH